MGSGTSKTKRPRLRIRKPFSDQDWRDWANEVHAGHMRATDMQNHRGQWITLRANTQAGVLEYFEGGEWRGLGYGAGGERRGPGWSAGGGAGASADAEFPNHNLLPGLQGGALWRGEYYHFQRPAHDELARFWDGGQWDLSNQYMADGHVDALHVRQKVGIGAGAEASPGYSLHVQKSVADGDQRTFAYFKNPSAANTAFANLTLEADTATATANLAMFAALYDSVTDGVDTWGNCAAVYSGIGASAMVVAAQYNAPIQFWVEEHIESPPSDTWYHVADVNKTGITGHVSPFWVGVAADPDLLSLEGEALTVSGALLVVEPTPNQHTIATIKSGTANYDPILYFADSGGNEYHLQYDESASRFQIVESGVGYPVVINDGGTVDVNRNLVVRGSMPNLSVSGSSAATNAWALLSIGSELGTDTTAGARFHNDATGWHIGVHTDDSFAVSHSYGGFMSSIVMKVTGYAGSAVLATDQINSLGNTLGLLTAPNAARSIYYFDNLYPDGAPSTGLHLYTYSARATAANTSGSDSTLYVTKQIRSDSGYNQTGVSSLVRLVGPNVHPTDATGAYSKLASLWVDGLNGAGAATITDYYGVYIGAPSGATNNYALFVAGGAVVLEYQAQSGSWTTPTGPTTNGRVVIVYNSSTTPYYRLFMVLNGGWHWWDADG